MDKYRGVMATTHVDEHKDRFTKEALEKIAEQINNHERIQWINWDHQTTLPPIAFVEKAWVEQLEDGEYGLFFEAIALTDQEDLVITEDLEITHEEIDDIQLGIARIELSNDPRNFSDQDVQAVVDELSSQFPTEQQHYFRKSEIPQSVVWLVVFFASGIAAGFLSKIGEVLADKVIEVTAQKLRNVGVILATLTTKALTKDRPDYIFIIPMQDSDVNVEGALESPDDHTLLEACKMLPELYIYANKLLLQNRENYFSDLKFLFNPISQHWEINFLTIRKTNQVVIGKRYFVPDHPLRHRYDEQVRKINELGKE
jgi:hypothetical protein